MKRLTENKIILISRATRLEELVARFNTLSQARFYIEHLGSDFSDYEREHNTYREAVRDTESQLRTLGRVQVLDRDFLPNFIFDNEDTVVVIGQDGLVANTLKYLGRQPVIAVNPDPKRWDGILLPFHVSDVLQITAETFAGMRKVREITMAKAELNNGQKLYGVNDLFIGQKTHVSARYQISLESRTEHQSSSGIIVSTGLGSTGWLKSILAGAKGIESALGNDIVKEGIERFNWGSEFLYYTVREPFPSRTSGSDMVFGKVMPDSPMHIISEMPENGVIFSDGIESDFLEFNSGTHATIAPAGRKGHLVV